MRYLSRMVGNQHVLQLLRERSVSPPSIQRVVTNFRNKALNAAEIYKKFQDSYSDDFQDLVKHGLDNRADLERWIDDNLVQVQAVMALHEALTRLRGEAQRRVQARVEQQLQQERALNSLMVDDLTFKYVAKAPSVESGRKVTTNPYGVNTGLIEFFASVEASGPANKLNEWSVGYVQTVLSMERHAIYTPTSAKGQVETDTWKVDTPYIDGPNPHVSAPWYDTYSGHNDLQAGAPFTVRLKDQPGFSFNVTGAASVDFSGQDHFHTWLVARKKDGSDYRIIAGWKWTADWAQGIVNVTANNDATGILFGGDVAKKIINQMQPVRH